MAVCEEAHARLCARLPTIQAIHPSRLSESSIRVFHPSGGSRAAAAPAPHPAMCLRICGPNRRAGGGGGAVLRAVVQGECKECKECRGRAGDVPYIRPSFRVPSESCRSESPAFPPPPVSRPAPRRRQATCRRARTGSRCSRCWPMFSLRRGSQTEAAFGRRQGTCRRARTGSGC